MAWVLNCQYLITYKLMFENFIEVGYLLVFKP
jgi:hypothetical protein